MLLPIFKNFIMKTERNSLKTQVLDSKYLKAKFVRHYLHGCTCALFYSVSVFKKCFLRSKFSSHYINPFDLEIRKKCGYGWLGVPIVKSFERERERKGNREQSKFLLDGFVLYLIALSEGATRKNRHLRGEQQLKMAVNTR